MLLADLGRYPKLNERQTAFLFRYRDQARERGDARTEAWALEQLVRGNWRLAVYLARGFVERTADAHDRAAVIMGALEGLGRAVRAFDPALGYTLGTYADEKVRQQAQIAAAKARQGAVKIPREQRRVADVASMDAPLPGKGRVTTLGETLADDGHEEAAERREQIDTARAFVHRGLDVLEGRDRYFIEQLFLCEREMKGLAEELGISRNRAYQIRDRALKRMRAALS